MRARFQLLLIAAAAAIALLATPASSQQLAKRLILKDGSYQLAVKYEIKGDRVHYLSAERGEWEDVPKSMVDWEATEKFEKDRNSGAPPPEAVQLDKELEAERKADEARTPLVAPGLRLSEYSSVALLDNYKGQPQLHCWSLRRPRSSWPSASSSKMVPTNWPSNTKSKGIVSTI